jgi:hypothetical protein
MFRGGGLEPPLCWVKDGRLTSLPIPDHFACSSTGTRPRTWTLRVQSATCYRFHHPCARLRPRGGGPAPPPHVVSLCVRASIHAALRVSAREHAELYISIFNVRIQGVKGQGPSSTDPRIGGDSRCGAKKKDLAMARPLDVREVVVVTEGSLLSSARPDRTYAAWNPVCRHAYPMDSSAGLSAVARTYVLRASRWLCTSWRHESITSRHALQAPSRFRSRRRRTIDARAGRDHPRQPRDQRDGATRTVKRSRGRRADQVEPKPRSAFNCRMH